jgi:hypothetical protein
MRGSVRGILGLAVFSLWAAQAGAQPEAVAPHASAVDELRAELQALREEYQARLAALEARLAALESAGEAPAVAEAPSPTPAAPTTQAAVPAGASGAGGPAGALPVYGTASAAMASKIFNPDVAVIGNFLGATGDNPVSGQPTLEMSEAELSLQAVVDPYARADFFLTFGPEEVGIEEGYLTFNELPGGLLAKVGKFKAGFGKVNTQHPHSLPWTDKPLAFVNLMGGEEGISQSGIGLSRLLPNDFAYVEASAEVSFGSSELFDSPRRQDLTYLGRLRLYRDLSDSTNIDLGGSILYGTSPLGTGFHNRVLGVDATLRWKPLRRSIYRSFLLRSELFFSRHDLEAGPAEAFGFYVSGDYQLARRLFLGARYDFSERAEDTDQHDTGGSLVLTYWPSEFSQVRGQLRHIEYAQGETANELLFQLLFSIGAHGAHPF